MEPTSAATIRPTDEDEIRTRRRPRRHRHRGRLGALLIQFPVSFKNTPLNREYLDRLLRQFIEYPRVVEVRDSSWDNAETLAAFAQKNVGFCNIDQPVLGHSLAPTEHVTAPIATSACTAATTTSGSIPTTATTATTTSTVRGNLQAGRIDRERRRKAQTTYVVTNNHFESKAGVKCSGAERPC